LIPILHIALQGDEIKMQYGAILARLVTNKDTRDEVFYVMQYAEENLNLDLSEKFESLSHAIILDAELFRTLLTKRLMNKNTKSTVLRNLLQFCIVGQAQCDIDDELFILAVFEERRRMMARLIAYTHNGPSLCAFAAVFAESEKMQPDGLAIAKSIIEYTVQEYPDSSEKFFSEKKKMNVSSKKASSLYSSATEHLIRTKKERDALPNLDELKPSSSQRLAMIHQDIKVNREINRAAEEKSIFSSIAKKVRILQGKKVATIMYDGRTSITEMGNMNYSIELPRSERADPIGGLIRRISWLEGAE
jgi:acetyl/propionyl-CoA carboxylase alpha subunit